MIAPSKALADYFTGPDVGHHSICLGLPGSDAQVRAQRFFDLRAEFKITGYCSSEAAAAQIRGTLEGAK